MKAWNLSPWQITYKYIGLQLLKVPSNLRRESDENQILISELLSMKSRHSLLSGLWNPFISGLGSQQRMVYQTQGVNQERNLLCNVSLPREAFTLPFLCNQHILWAPSLSFSPWPPPLTHGFHHVAYPLFSCHQFLSHSGPYSTLP